MVASLPAVGIRIGFGSWVGQTVERSKVISESVATICTVHADPFGNRCAAFSILSRIEISHV